jgi:hypothetical protein
LYEASRIPLPDDRLADNPHAESSAGFEGREPIISPIETKAVPPFQRWMSTLRRRHVHRWRETLSLSSSPRWSIDVVDLDGSVLSPLPDMAVSLRRRSGSMSSSLNYVTAMKSASITIASASIAPRSDGGPQPKIRLNYRDSNWSEARRSLDSNGAALGPVIDEGAWVRSVQRRRIVEEIISSEESYIGDLKVLINVRT